MFTGIVEATGRVRSLRKTRRGARLEIDGPFEVPVGASIAVSGVCLTALGGLRFDVIPETLRRTTLGSLRPGDRVNLERAMKSGARLDGHLVQGHVDGTGAVLRAGAVLEIGVDGRVAPYLAPKGSITVDGVSLTIVEAAADRFTVALIPHTRKITTLGRVRRGSLVNLEADVLMKLARTPKSSRISMAFLRKAGFAAGSKR